MQWFLHTNHPELLYYNVEADYDLTDGMTLLQFLQRTESFAHVSYKEDFHYLSDTLDQALDNRIIGFDTGRYISTVNKFMNQLGIEPFSFNDLPSEDPSLY